MIGCYYKKNEHARLHEKISSAKNKVTDID